MTNETKEINLSTTQWIEISDGASVGLITNNSEHSLRYRYSITQPSDSDTFGHVMHPQQERFFNLSNGLKVWGLGFSQRSRIALTKGFLGPHLGRVETSFAKGPTIDTADRLRVSERFGVFDNKNLTSRHPNQWEEHLEGVILEITSPIGTFIVNEEIRGTTPALEIPNGFITEDNTTSLVITCNRNRFQIGDTITGQNSGATAVITSVGTGSNISHNFNSSACTIRTGIRNGDRARREGSLPIAYQAGKGQDPSLTVKFAGQKANVVQRMGVGRYNADQLYFEVIENDIAFCIDSTVSGSVVTTRYPQSEWNLDRLDGGASGGPNPSGETLDITKVQFAAVPYLWQGVGPVQPALMIGNRTIYVHDILTANVADQVYIRNPSLPVFYEIENIGPTASPTEMLEICSTVSSEGGYRIPGMEITVDNDIVPRVIGVNGSPILAVRITNEFPAGRKNTRFAQFLEASIQSSVNDALIRIFHVHDPLDVVATWTPIGNDSGLEYSTDISSYIARPQHAIKTIHAVTGPANKPSSRSEGTRFINLHSYISQNIYSDASQMLVVWGKSQTGNANILASLAVTEFE